MAVTGIGLVSGVGRGVGPHWASLVESRHGLKPLSLFQAEGIPVGFVGEVPSSAIELNSRVSRTEALALTAASEALQDAQGHPQQDGIIAIGTTTGGIESSEKHYLQHLGSASVRDRDSLRRHAAGCIADRVASQFGLLGERQTISTACSSSANAIGYAAMRVELGSPWALAGGADSLCLITYCGFHALRLLSPEPCKPFDRARRGLSLGEGAAFLFLEPLSSARRRNKIPYGLISGWGCTADAYHMTAPDPEGRGAARAIRAALTDARVEPDEVDYINAHGTATPANDRTEALAIRSVFGDHNPPISSTKGITGHALGAAGAIEAAFSLLSLKNGFAPPSVGLVDGDPSLGLNLISKEGLTRELNVAVSHSFGFGGNNAVLVLTRGE